MFWPNKKKIDFFASVDLLEKWLLKYHANIIILASILCTLKQTERFESCSHFFIIKILICALKSHVNFRTEIRSRQSEERKTFSTCEKHHSSDQRPRTVCLHYSGFPATCVISRRPLASSIHLTRVFVSRKVVFWSKRDFPYRKWSKNSKNGLESIRQLQYFSGGLSG